MAVFTVRKGQLVSISAGGDELILTPPYPMGVGNVRLINVSGTSRWSVGATNASFNNVTTAGSTVTLSVDFSMQGDTNDVTGSPNRIHGAGVGTWRIEY
jgi:hypothetical protein